MHTRSDSGIPTLEKAVRKHVNNVGHSLYTCHTCSRSQKNVHRSTVEKAFQRRNGGTETAYLPTVPILLPLPDVPPAGARTPRLSRATQKRPWLDTEQQEAGRGGSRTHAACRRYAHTRARTINHSGRRGSSRACVDSKVRLACIYLMAEGGRRRKKRNKTIEPLPGHLDVFQPCPYLARPKVGRYETEKRRWPFSRSLFSRSTVLRVSATPTF